MPPQTNTTQPPQWMGLLSERDNAQITHAREYAARFSSAGIPGHSQLILIAVLAQLLDAHEAQAKAVRP